ncbi:MAG: response regulator, partial [Caldilineaceae bacterium]|nr:response regulator [Caldilineaceae bacterium]
MLLTHLYDPLYQPSPLLMRALGVSPQQGATGLQQAVKVASGQLAPTAETPATARSRRFYTLLAHRYVQEMTQEETAHHLGITARHLRREQQQAIHALAQQLWDQPLAPIAPAPDHLSVPTTLSAEEAAQAWRAQTQQELALLQQNSPGAIAEIAEVLAGVVTIGAALGARHHVTLHADLIKPTLTAVIHPSALRQMVLAAVEKLCQGMVGGEIDLRGRTADGQIEIEIVAAPFPAATKVTTDLMDEIAGAYQGTVRCRTGTTERMIQIHLPVAKPVTVLVIDDNDDLVHFYRRYTARTRYSIVQVAEGREALATAKTVQPALILLDVMLPDLDGWELLTALQADPVTRVIPVIICSVVRRPELAQTLGAAHYLTKPVARLDLLRALEQVYTTHATT